jgi:hypothetical protein
MSSLTFTLQVSAVIHKMEVGGVVQLLCTGDPHYVPYTLLLIS